MCLRVLLALRSQPYRHIKTHTLSLSISLSLSLSLSLPAHTPQVTFTTALKEMKTLLESLPATAHVAAAVSPALTALSVKYCITSGFWVRYNQV
jgi:hypothetical protein